MKSIKQAEAEVVPSSSIVEVGVDVEVAVEVEVGVGGSRLWMGLLFWSGGWVGGLLEI